MKKQKQVSVSKNSLMDSVKGTNKKEVAPPAEANRGMDGKVSISKAVAAQKWFKAAKEENPSSGFLDVSSENVEVKSNATAEERSMLYKGNKK